VGIHEAKNLVQNTVILVGKHEGRRFFGKLKSRWEYNIKNDVGWEEDMAAFMWLRTGISGGLL
jgi:hypothetical protein